MKKVHLTLTSDQKVFFTSDLHVGHRNVLRFCNRPFADIKEMSEKLIENWNSVVGENDIVFDLGDMFWFDGRHDVKKFVEKLNGTLYKVPGNHDMDTHTLFGLCNSDKVILLDDINTIWITGLFPSIPSKTVELVVCHYPLATFPHFENNVIQLYGHIHSGPLSENKVDNLGKDLILNKKQYDVGTDNNNFTPIELREIYKKLGMFVESFSN